MSAFDTTYNIMSMSAHAPSEEQLAAGADPLVVVQITPGLMLPMEDPRNPGNPLIIPIGNVRYKLDSDAAVEMGETLVIEGKRLPKRSHILTASSLAGVDQVAERLSAMKAA